MPIKNLNPCNQKVSNTKKFSHWMGEKKPTTLFQKINILVSTTVITSLGIREET